MAYKYLYEMYIKTQISMHQSFNVVVTHRKQHKDLRFSMIGEDRDYFFGPHPSMI